MREKSPIKRLILNHVCVRVHHILLYFLLDIVLHVLLNVISLKSDDSVLLRDYATYWVLKTKMNQNWVLKHHNTRQTKTSHIMSLLSQLIRVGPPSPRHLNFERRKMLLNSPFIFSNFFDMRPKTEEKLGLVAQLKLFEVSACGLHAFIPFNPVVQHQTTG